MTDRALSFGAAATIYDRVRPGYPPEAVRWALDGLRAPRVIDLGAGTGIFTRVLLAAGVDVTPVEPDPGMRAALEQATGLAALAGSAERIPVPDAGADAVLAAQAYHWFDHDRAHAEIARVLRPGGVFAPLWNLRDESVPWVAEYSRIVNGEGGAGGPGHGGRLVDPDFGPHFGPVASLSLRHDVPHTRESLLDLARSRSGYLTGDDALRARIDRELATLIDTHPALAGRETYLMPYETVVYRAIRHESRAGAARRR